MIATVTIQSLSNRGPRHSRQKYCFIAWNILGKDICNGTITYHWFWVILIHRYLCTCFLHLVAFLRAYLGLSIQTSDLNGQIVKIWQAINQCHVWREPNNNEKVWHILHDCDLRIQPQIVCQRWFGFCTYNTNLLGLNKKLRFKFKWKVSCPNPLLFSILYRYPWLARIRVAIF